MENSVHKCPLLHPSAPCGHSTLCDTSSSSAAASTTVSWSPAAHPPSPQSSWSGRKQLPSFGWRRVPVRYATSCVHLKLRVRVTRSLQCTVVMSCVGAVGRSGSYELLKDVLRDICSFNVGLPSRCSNAAHGPKERKRSHFKKYMTMTSGFDLSHKRRRPPQISQKIASRTTRVKATPRRSRPIQMRGVLRTHVSRCLLALSEGEIAALTAANSILAPREELKHLPSSTSSSLMSGRHKHWIRRWLESKWLKHMFWVE